MTPANSDKETLLKTVKSSSMTIKEIPKSRFRTPVAVVIAVTFSAAAAILALGSHTMDPFGDDFTSSRRRGSLFSRDLRFFNKGSCSSSCEDDPCDLNLCEAGDTCFAYLEPGIFACQSDDRKFCGFAGLTCPAGQFCVLFECYEDDPCGGCPTGQVCDKITFALSPVSFSFS